MKRQERRRKAKRLKGRMKEAAGILTGNKELENEGSRERSAGAVQETHGKARRKVGELLHGAVESVEK